MNFYKVSNLNGSALADLSFQWRTLFLRKSCELITNFFYSCSSFLWHRFASLQINTSWELPRSLLIIAVHQCQINKFQFNSRNPFSLRGINLLKVVVLILSDSVCWHQVAELYLILLAHEWRNVPVNLNCTESRKEEILGMSKFVVWEFHFERTS